MPTSEAKAEVDPRVSGFQALFTTTAMRFHISNLVQVLTLFHIYGIYTAKQVSPESDVVFKCRAELYSRTFRNRNALLITDTELSVMAALAITGLNNNPKNGYRTPAAIGTPKML
jgi:hypothetical protein